MVDFLNPLGTRQTRRNRTLSHHLILARVDGHLAVGCACGCLPVLSVGDIVADWTAYNRLAHDWSRGPFHQVDPSTGRTNWWAPTAAMADLEDGP